MPHQYMYPKVVPVVRGSATPATPVAAPVPAAVATPPR